MELLLILTALFTGLTGAFSGDRLDGRAPAQASGFEAQAVADAVEMAEAAVSAVRHIGVEAPRWLRAPVALSTASRPWAIVTAIGTSERRLE